MVDAYTHLYQVILMVQPSAQEQYMLEMVNRARLNPQGEADLYGINLNDGLNPGTISSDPKQPLAFNLLLIDSSRAHSQWMLDTDTFSHTGVNGTSSNQRMRNAGYQFTGSWGSGENIGYKGTTGTVDITAFTADIHQSLFESAGHRKNILKADFQEIGIGNLTGEFGGYNSLMVTQNFAFSGSDVFLTGVAYDDHLILDDDFYTVGEGLAEIDVTATNTSSGNFYTTSTMDAGGYQLALLPGTYNVTFSNDSQTIGSSKQITVGSENIKLDLDTSNISPITTQHIGEVGTISNLNHLNRTIELNNTYNNPVVFAMPLSYNGGDPAIARITDIQNDSFSVYAQEPEYKDGTHIDESFSYIVLEAGTWELDNGTTLEVGKLDTNGITTSKWETVDFSDDFQQTPVILSQVQTNNGTQFVRTRQKNQSVDGFQLTMEEEEALKFSGHATETVGWLAIETGSGDWDGLDYQAGTTGSKIDHTWDMVSFGETFEEAPNLLASLSSFNGGDSSGLRYRSLGASEVQIKVEEDRSLDDEIVHTLESVDYLAIAGSGDLSAII